MLLTLIKIFSKGFYKKYAKAFMFGFCMFFSYCIFIQTAGEFLTESSDFWTMFISLKVATDPFFIALFWLFSLFYAILFSKYIRMQLKEEKNTFLQYTLNGINVRSRFRNWTVVTLIGFIPLLLYACYSLGIGYYIAKNYKGLLTVLYLLILIIATAIYTDQFRLISINEGRDIFLSYSKKFNRRQLNLFNIYNHVINNRTSFVVTKLISLLTIYTLTTLFDIKETENNTRYVIYLTMTLACVNSVLLYKDFIFEGKKLIFLLNFPVSKIRRFISSIPYFVLLVLPEMIFIISAFKFHLFVVAICSTVIFLLSVRSLIFLVGNSPLSVIKSISTYYFLALIFILYELHYFVLFVTLIASYLIFIRNSTYEKLQNNQD